MLHPSELGLNFSAPGILKPERVNPRGLGLLFQICCELQTITDADHRFYLEAEGLELGSQAVDIDAQADGVIWLMVAPSDLPEFFGSDYASGTSGEARDNQELRAREVDRMSLDGDVIVVMLDAQMTVVVNICFNILYEAFRLNHGHKESDK